MRVCLVIPAHNEEQVLERNVQTVRRFLADHPTGDAFIILIAENGSTDGTLEVAKRLSERWSPDVRYWHSPTPGRGAALKSVWSSSDADIVGYMDADLSTELDALPRALDELRRGADIVTGSRLLRGSKVGRVWSREVTSRVYNLWRRLALGSPIRDSQCGFKFMRRDKILPLLPRVEDDKWFFDTELLTRAGDARLKVVEIPITWAENRKSTVKVFATIVQEGKGIMRLRRRKPL